LIYKGGILNTKSFDKTPIEKKSVETPKEEIKPNDARYNYYFRGIFSDIFKSTIDSFSVDELKGLFETVEQDLVKKNIKSLKTEENLVERALTFRLLNWYKKELDSLINRSNDNLVEYYQELLNEDPNQLTISKRTIFETIVSLLYDSPDKIVPNPEREITEEEIKE